MTVLFLNLKRPLNSIFLNSVATIIDDTFFPYPSHILWVIFSVSMVLNYLCFMTFKSIPLGLSFDLHVQFLFLYIYVSFCGGGGAAVGLRCCPWAFSSRGEQGLLSSCSALGF